MRSNLVAKHTLTSKSCSNLFIARRLELINAVVDSQRVSEEVKWDDAPPPSYDEVMADSSKFQTVSNV